jgi:hypothetical protein
MSKEPKHLAKRSLVGLPLVAVVLLFLLGRCQPTAKRALTAADVDRIKAILAQEEPSRYRLTLPEFRDGRVVGTQVIGAMPIDQVELIASRQKLTIRPSANLHVVFAGSLGSGDGGAGGGGGGNGPNSHITTSTARFNEIEGIVARLNQQLNQLIIE